MSWERATEREQLLEWKRSDGNATIRLREQSNDRWVVRFDRLHQAPEGMDYRFEVADDREAAMALIEEWQRQFDVTDD